MYAHTDSNASSVSNRVNARAFTVGNHVAFGGGEYKPGTLAGDALIAHELAHTVQQQGAEGSVSKWKRVVKTTMRWKMMRTKLPYR